MPKPKYNKQGERVIAELPEVNDGSHIDACYDEDEDILYLRWHPRRGRLQEVAVNQKEWEKLTAAKIDEWSEDEEEEEKEET